MTAASQGDTYDDHVTLNFAARLSHTGINASCRSLHDADLSFVAALAVDCLQKDGGLPLLATHSFLKEQTWMLPPCRAIGVFLDEDTLIGCCMVNVEDANGTRRITAHGLVHPAYRRRGLGGAFAEWTMDMVAAWQNEGNTENKSVTLIVANETLTDMSARFYINRGLTQVFGERVLRFDLRQALPPLCPSQAMDNETEMLDVENWTEARAPAFFQAYENAFRNRPGFPNWPQEHWIEANVGDPDFSPHHSFLVSNRTVPIAFVLCADRYITQIGVDPQWRRRGIATSLLCRSLACLRADGFTEALLMVNDNNSPALAVYSDFGFQQIGRRGRFQKDIQTNMQTKTPQKV